jgi:hypothetical protein
MDSMARIVAIRSGTWLSARQMWHSALMYCSDGVWPPFSIRLTLVKWQPIAPLGLDP